MSREQSRRTQRALERALFGPTPPPLRREAPRAHKQLPAPPPGRKGDCWACGNICTPRDDWQCDTCGHTYPGGRTTRAGLDGFVIEVLECECGGCGNA